MPLDNKISNILGVRIPEWLYQQLQTRSAQNSKTYRDNNNLIYLANKTAWVRLVSSINIKDPRDATYFRNLGVDITTDENSLAQQFTLFGGTSAYLNNKNNLRTGLGKGGSYGTLGDSEIQKYGYRPMPGITSVNIETKGRLGSVREATVNFKCFDKDQLDIIDALYFKLGYSMFLEWGHTYYYPSQGDVANPSKYDPTKVRSTEFYTINPFEAGLTKEEILRRISQNSRDSEGNYDAMLGIATHFNFSFNQDGAYDCTLRIAALGSLGDSIKINNPSNLPDILKGTIKQYNSVLEQIARAKEAKEEAERRAREEAERLKNQNLEDLKNRTLNEIIADTPYPLKNESYPSNVQTNDNKFADATLKTDEYGDLFIIRRLNGFIPTEDDLLQTVGFRLDPLKLFQLFSEYNLTFSDVNSWELENETGIGDVLAASFDDSFFPGIEEFLTEIQAPISYDAIRDNFGAAFKLFKKTNIPIRVLNAAEKLTNPKQLTKLIASEALQNSIVRLKTTKKYANEYDRNTTYEIEIKRKYFAKSTNPNAVDQYKIIGANNYYSNIENQNEGFIQYLQNNDIKITDFKILDTRVNGKIGVEFVFTFNIPITKKSDIKQRKSSVSIGEEEFEIIPQQDVVYNVETEVRIQDTYLIKSFTPFKKGAVGVDQPVDFLSYEKQLVDQNQGTKEEDQISPQDANSDQTESPLSNLSSLELILRTIQVHSLSEAIQKSDLDIGREVQPIPFGENEKFINQIFSSGVFTPFINELISGNIPDRDYDNINNTNSDYRFKVQSKYGFATNLMANREKLYEKDGAPNFSPVDYKKLLTAYVVPYDISQEIESGTQLNHPVYIPFGTLLMILNHSATIYDVKEGSAQTPLQKPLIYIDFNPNYNYCLSNPNQLSTDPWTCLIPFEGKTEDYRKLFEDDILTEDKTAIAPLSDSTESTPLFDPRSDIEESRDNLSGAILSFKYDGESSPYRGKIMNILLNIDYLMNTIRMFSTKNDENKVFLKPFLEQIIIDVSKSLGNFNIFRLSYNDGGNTYQFTDDQIIPTKDKEVMLELTANNNPTLPLFGKTSIAKSIDIKTEISSKLSNMLAISANADTTSKATLSTDGSTFGYINTNFVDRYIQNRKEPSQEKNKDKASDGLKNTAIQFNSAIESFYNSISPSQQSVGMATNYFINKVTKIKGNEPPTRASVMIPVSVNFTTDGISGFNMGHGFTLHNELIPYTYSTRIFDDQKDHLNRVGFVVVGLSHTIENNSWNTSVRANMIFLKDRSMFNLENDKQYKRQKAGPLAAPDEDTIDAYSALDNYSNYPQAQSSQYSNIRFGTGYLGKPANEKINPNLLSDINTAAKNSGVIVTITTAISGHKTLTKSGAISRHALGNAVDIAIIDGESVSNKQKVESKVENFLSKLAALGYIRVKKGDRESGKVKAVLAYGFPDHEDHIHISNKQLA